MDIFRDMNINLQSVKDNLEQRVREDELGIPISSNNLLLNEKASNILKLAVLEARIYNTQQVEELHLLLAILHDHVKNGAQQVLENNNMKYDDVLSLLHAPHRTKIKDGIGLPDEDFEDEEESDPEAADARRQELQRRLDTLKQLIDARAEDYEDGAFC